MFCVAYYVGCGYKGSWFADCLMCLACREGTASLASLVDTPHQTRAIELLIANAEVNFSNIFCCFMLKRKKKTLEMIFADVENTEFHDYFNPVITTVLTVVTSFLCKP